MRNAEGTYVVTRLMNQTGTLLTGTGKTKEQAREKLRNEVKKYQEAMRLGLYLVPTGETVTSPGLVSHRTDRGNITLQHDSRRQMQVVARPDLAKYIQDGKKSNVLKETRQIRRARERGNG